MEKLRYERDQLRMELLTHAMSPADARSLHRKIIIITTQINMMSAGPVGVL